MAYLSNLPSGHVTYDLVGSMLRFHTDKELTVYWASGAADLASIVGNGLKVPSFQANQHLLDLSHATPQQQYTQVRKTAPATSTPAAAEAGAAKYPTNSGAARAHDSTGVGAGVGHAMPTTQPV